jgi:hypothetical protein
VRISRERSSLKAQSQRLIVRILPSSRSIVTVLQPRER